MGLISGLLKTALVAGTAYAGFKVGSRYKENNPDGNASTQETFDAVKQAAGEVYQEAAAYVNDKAPGVAEKASEIAGKVAEKAPEFAAKAEELAGKVSEKAPGVAEKAAEIISSVTDKLTSAPQNGEDTAEADFETIVAETTEDSSAGETKE